ncbi:hypothetical protein JFN93_13155 [Geomonas sp. Red875]|uniref:Uncharacterized protein n=2 Tax=Geomesophilobacter sediminis TaxID=2798584 RepID=A0A8J7JEH7_9BACT|nr:hypothetical protein [Geomesophilobacter sediminis]
MNDNDAIYSDVLNYFAAEFDALEERLKTGALDDYRERVLVSRKIGEAVNLLSPYVRSDPRARHLVRNAEALKKELLSVRELMVKQMLQQKEQQSLLRSIIERKKPGVGETL